MSTPLFSPAFLSDLYSYLAFMLTTAPGLLATFWSLSIIYLTCCIAALSTRIEHEWKEDAKEHDAHIRLRLQEQSQEQQAAA